MDEQLIKSRKINTNIWCIILTLGCAVYFSYAVFSKATYSLYGGTQRERSDHVRLGSLLIQQDETVQVEYVMGIGDSFRATGTHSPFNALVGPSVFLSVWFLLYRGSGGSSCSFTSPSKRRIYNKGSARSVICLWELLNKLFVSRVFRL
jgi:hypothetical protein